MSFLSALAYFLQPALRNNLVCHPGGEQEAKRKLKKEESLAAKCESVECDSNKRGNVKHKALLIAVDF